MSARKRDAQVSAGRHRNLHLDRLADSRAALSEAQARQRDDDQIRVDLPETVVPAGRTRLAPTTSPARIHARLAQFLLRGRQVELPASTLSGGERSAR